MILNLLALATLLSALIAGTVLLWRRIPALEQAAVGEPVCQVCATPARLLSPDSFCCHVCGHDVRTRGIAPPRGARPYSGPLWRAVQFTAGICVAALLVTTLLSTVVPRVENISAEQDWWASDAPYRRLSFTVIGQREQAPGASLVGQLYGDLFLLSGEVISLEIQSPSLHYQITHPDGAVESRAEPFDEPAARRWLAMAEGYTEADPIIRSQAQKVLIQVHEMLKLPRPQLAPVPAVLPSGSSSSSGGSSSGSDPARFFTRTAIILWSILWMAGLWAILRPRALQAAPATSAGPPNREAVS